MRQLLPHPANTPRSNEPGYWRSSCLHSPRSPNAGATAAQAFSQNFKVGLAAEHGSTDKHDVQWKAGADLR